MELVVEVHERGVGVEVAHVVAGVLGVDARLVAAEAALPAPLREEVAVPLLLRVLEDVVDYGAGDAAVRVVVVELAVPV